MLAEQQLWNDKDRRGVSVPASLSPPGQPCTDNLYDVKGSCTEVSYTGDYYPLAYVLPAVGIAASNVWQTALLLSRVGSLVQMLIFLGLAVLLSGPKAGWRLVGLLAATTPMVLFIGSMMNPNGLEIAANLAFVAALLRLRRDPTGFPGWGWISLIASGVVTVLAWQLGPFFAAVDVAAWAGLMGTRELRALYAARGSRVLSAAAIMTAAIALFVGYGGAAGVLHSTREPCLAADLPERFPEPAEAIAPGSGGRFRSAHRPAALGDDHRLVGGGGAPVRGRPVVRQPPRAGRARADGVDRSRVPGGVLRVLRTASAATASRAGTSSRPSRSPR